MSSNMEDIPPNHTLYINNLNEKLKKEKLKEALFAIFSQFGQIIDILVFKNLRMRGQAHIIFKEITSSSKALRAMQGFPFFDKPMRIQYAKIDSDAIAKAKGTFVQKDKKPFIPLPKKRKVLGGVDGNGDEPSSNSHVPNQILFVQNLPETSNTDMLSGVFNSFPGLKDIRLVPNRTDIAFIEYYTEEEATIAKKALHNHRLENGQPMKVDYANK
uniref:U2 small nuclear ribonucleoprotein B n=1 Tax=Rhabditophanes sp. KR3021 TaxID=114890 RepID=A0AC35U9U4_9BILA